ncbi:MAG: hypothetical protein AB1815_11395 [Bacillota bacterium]
MAKQSKQEVILTPSGHQVDKDLLRVPIKVTPSLQALLANQFDLIEMLENKQSLNPVFIEQHRMEMLQLEEEIASAFAAQVKKKEKALARQAEKKQVLAAPGPPLKGPVREKPDLPREDEDMRESKALQRDPEAELDALANFLSPGLPSAKIARRAPAAEKPPEVDVRRVALGASIKALMDFLGRDLTEEESLILENQVDAYLVKG